MSNSNVSIEGLDKGAVLAALYNASKPQGMGFLHYDPTPMTAEQGAELLKQTTNFDSLKGRVMKINLASDTEFDPRWYDRCNGFEAAAVVVSTLRETGSADNYYSEVKHAIATEDARQTLLAQIEGSRRQDAA